MRNELKAFGMKFTIIKSQGSGNDFFLIDIRHFNGAINLEMKKSMAIALCERNTAFGADGILFVDNSETPGADARMVIFNADGSEAEMCGNGIRIVARYVAEGLKKHDVTIENITGIAFKLHDVDDFFDGVNAYQLSFPKANFQANLIPLIIDGPVLKNELIPALSTDLNFTAISLPNPHIVSFVDRIDETELGKIGFKANHLPAVLPNGVNVNLGKVLDKKSIYVATYERGVGITYSCGTGMFATALSAVSNGLAPASEWITLFNKGGYTKCFINEDFSGKMIGNASYIYESEIDFDFDNTNHIITKPGNDFAQETASYNNLLNHVSELQAS